MTEAEFQAMLSRSQAKKAEAQERAQAQAQRREAVLTKAIQTNRVRVDFAEISDQGDLRSYFDSDMNRVLRNSAAAAPGDTSGNED